MCSSFYSRSKSHVQTPDVFKLLKVSWVIRVGKSREPLEVVFTFQLFTRLIKELESQMKTAARNLEFEKAALLRDRIIELRKDSDE